MKKILHDFEIHNKKMATFAPYTYCMYNKIESIMHLYFRTPTGCTVELCNYVFRCELRIRLAPALYSCVLPHPYLNPFRLVPPMADAGNHSRCIARLFGPKGKEPELNPFDTRDWFRNFMANQFLPQQKKKGSSSEIESKATGKKKKKQKHNCILNEKIYYALVNSGQLPKRTRV
jgi:hypothetical protein